MRTILRGTEAATLELSGEIDAAVPAPFTPTGEASLLLFAMRDLALDGIRWPAFDYHEALWRIGVRLDGVPAWFAVRCDIDSPVVRAIGRRLVRYPTRGARFAWDASRWRVDTDDGKLAVEVADRSADADAAPPRRTFVPSGERVFEIPWREVPAPTCAVARVAIADDALSTTSFGAPVRWSTTARALAGRVHMCGIATPLRG